MAEAATTAALLIIGNEILSGRTRDTNLTALAGLLNARGIPLAQVRVVRDDEAAIVTALDALRTAHTHVFTSGGIGPTHDDITTASVARAFGVAVVRSAAAEAEMRAHYTATGREATAARLRMADVPAGATLIRCPQSPAPGFTIGNVHVLAGVPDIFAGMAAAVTATLPAGPARVSRTVTVAIGESEVAAELAQVQDAHPHLELGSYPQRDGDRFYAELVVAGTDPAAVDIAVAQLTGLLDGRAVAWTLS